MKLALVIEKMDPQRGGRELSTAQIAAELAGRGCEVTILCQTGEWQCEGVKIIELGRRGCCRSRRQVNFLADLARAIDEGDYDVVHATLPVPGATVYQPRGGTIPAQVAASGRRWKRLGPIRVGLFERINLSRRKLARLERAVMADRDVLCLGVSSMVTREFADHYGRRENVRTIYNAVDVPPVDANQWAQWRQQRRDELGAASGDVVFITVATNYALKGVNEAIRAFGQLLHNRPQLGARLVVVGQDRFDRQQRLADFCQVGNRVTFLPRTPDIYPWYAAADACVLLSWYDPCSRTVLEATRLGIPSITTEFNGAAKILAEGAGIVVSSPADLAAVTAAMEELSDPTVRSACSEAGRHVADRLSIARHVDQLLEAYEEARKSP